VHAARGRVVNTFWVSKPESAKVTQLSPLLLEFSQHLYDMRDGTIDFLVGPRHPADFVERVDEFDRGHACKHSTVVCPLDIQNIEQQKVTP
jgi:hypothetical protein